MNALQAINLTKGIVTAKEMIEYQVETSKTIKLAEKVLDDLAENPEITISNAIQITRVLTEAMIIADNEEIESTAKEIKAAFNVLYEIAKETENRVLKIA